MILGLVITATLLTLLWVSFPLIAAGNDPMKRVDEVSVREREQAMLTALQKLTEDREAGLISEDDYPAMERRLVADLARLYQEAGIEPGGMEGAEEPVTTDATGCLRCGAARGDEFRFCPSCGQAYVTAA